MVPAKDCNEPLKMESSSDINQEYRQLLGVYSYLQFYSSSSLVKISSESSDTPEVALFATPKLSEKVLRKGRSVAKREELP